jgi:hypothetical protein
MSILVGFAFRKTRDPDPELCGDGLPYYPLNSPRNGRRESPIHLHIYTSTGYWNDFRIYLVLSDTSLKDERRISSNVNIIN